MCGLLVWLRALGLAFWSGFVSIGVALRCFADVGGMHLDRFADGPGITREALGMVQEWLFLMLWVGGWEWATHTEAFET